MLILTACSQDAPTTEQPVTTVTSLEMLELTLEELSQFNGKDGNPAYIAFEGKIYDVTEHPKWTQGMHNGNVAGTDITQAIQNAPHGTSKINTIPQVGILK